MNRDPEAIASYDKAIEFDHHDPGVWYMRGNSLYQKFGFKTLSF